MLDSERLGNAVLHGDRDAVRALVTASLEAGADPTQILNQGLLPAMDVVGQRFGAKTIFINEVLLAARAMHVGMDLLRPALAKSRRQSGSRPVVLLGTVRGDLHDIGKNLVGMMLEAGGFDVVDLGTNVGTERLIQAITEHRPSVVGLSTLLTTTMRQMSRTLEELRRARLLEGVKTIIGGAPVTQAFADTIGADGYAPDATRAAPTVWKLLGASEPH